LLGGALQRRGHEIHLRGDLGGHFLHGGAVTLFVQHLGQLGASVLALFHGGAQGGLDHVDPRFQLAPAGFRGQQLGLHGRDLGQGGVEPALCGHRLFGAGVTFLRERVQAFLIGGLIPLGLFAEIAGADAVHQQDGGGNDGPCDQQRGAAKGDQLGLGPKPDEPCIGVGFQKDPAFGKFLLQKRVDFDRQTCSHAPIPCCPLTKPRD